MDINYPKGVKLEAKIGKPDNGGCVLSIMSAPNLALLKKMVDKEVRSRKAKISRQEFSNKMDDLFRVIKNICDDSAKQKK